MYQVWLTMDTAGAVSKKKLVNVYHCAATVTELNTGRINAQ